LQVLTRAIGDRILLGVLCSVVTFFLSLICSAVEQWQASSSTERFWQHVAFEVFLAFAVFTGFGVLWTVFAPRWMERLLQSAYHKVVLTISVVAGTSVCTALYFTFLK
jgi:uncharacterized membrane protein (DUF485 family)